MRLQQKLDRKKWDWTNKAHDNCRHGGFFKCSCMTCKSEIAGNQHEQAHSRGIEKEYIQKKARLLYKPKFYSKENL